MKDFFPITCLGSWQDPANAQGTPESLAATGTAITSQNASVFDPTAPISQIFCGAFVPSDYQTEGDIKSVGLTLVWNMPSLALNTSSTNSFSPPTSVGTSSVSAPGTSTVATGTSARAFLQPFSFFFKVAFADSTDTVTTTAVSDTSTPPASGAANQTTTVATTTTVGTSTTTSPPPSTPTGTPSIAPLNASSSGATSTGVSSSSSSVPSLATPSPDDHFLKVSYSLDGQTWIGLSEVSPSNWQNFTATLPVKSWDDLKKLQVKIEGIPTSLQQIPKVYLDGMFVEAHYEIPPVLPISINGGTSPTPSVATGTSTVVVLPPGTQPVPVNQSNDFKANESPTFDFDLNALPAPTSTQAPPSDSTSSAATPTPTSTATPTVAPSSPSPPATDTSSSTGLAAPSAPLSFFFGGLRRAVADAFNAFGARLVAYAQSVSGAGGKNVLPDENNPIIARIFGPNGKLTDLQPVTLVTGGNLRVILPNAGRAFAPGRYSLKLSIWKDGVVYETQSDFSWGVLVVNFNKSIYTQGDEVHAGFTVLDDAGDTICGADVSMDVIAPGGSISHFTTADGSIQRNATCGANNVTSAPDYSAMLAAGNTGTYVVSVSASTQNGVRTITDQFVVQASPLFDVERQAPTRIFPPSPYQVSFVVKANANFNGNIIETVPASFSVSVGGANEFVSGDAHVISWPVKLSVGDSVTLNYAFLAPPTSPELYKLGPLRIGSWEEARQWQIAADANTVIYITSTASTTWTVPSDWNNSSNTIELIGGGGGGATAQAGQGGAAGGGGGAAYAKITNFSTSTGNNVKIQVGKAGGAGATGTISFFNWNGSGSTSTCSGTTMQLCAMPGGAGLGPAGGSGVGGSGGASSTSIGSTKAAGGDGGGTSSHGGGNSGVGGGGGGGAGGCSATVCISTSPGADGNVGGTTGPGATAGSTGGQGDGTFGGGGGGADTAGTAGTEFDGSSKGSGGGGGGGTGGGNRGAGSNGQAGGNYGAGGGGGGEGGKSGSPGGTGGSGVQGIIVITYTPAAAGGSPSVTNVKLNNGSAITLTPNTTTSITVTASTTDPSGPGNISYATGTIYRTSLGQSCSASNLNCYQIASSSCSFSGSTSTVTCTAGIWYFAQSTGNASSSFPSDSWSGAITVTNATAATGTATSTGVNINILTAINVTTSSISYGTLAASSTTGGTNQTTTVTNAGNSSTTLQISGTALLKGANLVPTSSQHYATSSFTFGGNEQQLNGSPSTVSGFRLTAPTTTTNVQGDIFWGITIPAGNPTGTYNGTSTFTAVFTQ